MKTVKPDNNYIYNEEWARSPKRDKIWVKDFANVLIRLLNPTSVIDIGCGSGDILAPFEKNNLDVLGLDGSIAIQDRLKIKRENFALFDLRDEYNPERRYDLALVLEVGEHVEKDFDDIFIDNICKTSDKVLWTADVRGPFFYHPNPQKTKYWIEKFKKRGYFVDRKMTKKLRKLVSEIDNIKENYYVRLTLFVKRKQLFKRTLSGILGKFLLIREGHRV